MRKVSARRALPGLVVALALAPAAAAQSSVIVVGDLPWPFADFDNMADAVAVANEHDTILIREGTYTQFDVVGKSLVILADAGAALTFTDFCSVRNLGP